jgi:hypothetical protein
MAALLGRSERATYKPVYRQGLPDRRPSRTVIFLRQEVEARLDGLPGLPLGHVGRGQQSGQRREDEPVSVWGHTHRS